MATDERIDEVLKVLREQGERSEARFGRIEARFGGIEGRADELSTLIREEREINNSRFTQLATGLSDLRKEVHSGLAGVNTKIDKVYDSLSQDIQIFAEDLHHVERRVTRLEKKLLS